MDIKFVFVTYVPDVTIFDIVKKEYNLIAYHFNFVSNTKGTFIHFEH